ncbi:zinc-binding dehydrogenase [Streptomyces sp. NPDC053750]|uniref:zinc-binding dehydrogenase n=1 Tax=Streptomyces sp. NPDC053750 TaxID=3365714 RepID=UPI0037D74E59
MGIWLAWRRMVCRLARAGDGNGRALIGPGRAPSARLVALVSTTHKAQRVLDIGAEAAIDLSAQDLASAVADITDGQGADAALDPVGGVRLGELLRCVRLRGTVVSLGFTGCKLAELDIVDLLMGEKHLTVYAVHNEPEEVIAPALKTIGAVAAQGLLRSVIDSRFAFGDFEDAFARLTSRQAIGAIVLNF